MKLHPLTVSYTDIPKLLDAVEGLGVTAPPLLSDVVKAHEKLVSASPVPTLPASS
jgi:hypothetical protein